MAQWQTLKLDKKFIIYTNEKSSLIQVPNSTYRFWYPNKILKGISNKSIVFVNLLYTNDFIFKLFKSKKIQNNWQQYDDKEIKIEGLQEIISADDVLKIYCEKNKILYNNKTSYLISYLNLEYNYVKFWISNKFCTINDSSITILLVEDEYDVEIEKDDFSVDKIRESAKELAENFTESKEQIHYDKTKAPNRIQIPKNIIIDNDLIDESDYNETGVLQTKTKMFLHQQKAVSKVLPARCNALFMDMGTGKTRTTIELLKIRQNQYDKVFWFTPVSLKYNVYLEFLKHTNLKKEDIYLFNQKTTDKTEIKQKFIIVGIESLASSDRTHLALDSMIKENSFIVVDESSFIKGNSKRTKRIVRLTKHTKYRTILTGTPISQGIVDLYNQMYFLSPKILDYRNFYQFANNHLQYHKKIPGMIIAEYNKEYIAAKIAPYTYQVTKEECLDLKGKKYIEKYFHMSDEQNKMYQSAKEDFFESFESYETDSVFLLFNELQQIISGFKYTKNKKAKIINTIRAEVLKNIIEEIGEKQKIIIWTKYTADIEIIESMLIDNFKDSEYVIFSGSKNESEKAMALNNFKYNDEVRFFIATQSTGAFGLNLPEASYTVFYNNGFKYSERIQAEDRNYRIGQNEAVTYIDIICNNSIDTKIYNTLLSKGNVATSFKKDLEQVKDKKLKKSLLNAIIDGNLDEVNRIIEKAKLAQENTAAKRMEKMRRKKGVIKRKDYLQNSITQKAPWKELGISRTTWYRNLKSEKE